jgi:hypothetical protein
MMPRVFNPKPQSGAVLFMTLIFLVLITVMALTTFTVSKGTQQVVGNTAARNLTYATAWQTSENAISSVYITSDPTKMLYDGVSSYTTVLPVDVNGDGKTVVNASIPASGRPSCVAATTLISNTITDPVASQRCLNSNILAQTCYNLHFQFSALATDSVTNATSTVSQGVSLPAMPADAHTLCRGPGGEQYLN